MIKLGYTFLKERRKKKQETNADSTLTNTVELWLFVDKVNLKCQLMNESVKGGGWDGGGGGGRGSVAGDVWVSGG